MSDEYGNNDPNGMAHANATSRHGREWSGFMQNREIKAYGTLTHPFIWLEICSLLAQCTSSLFIDCSGYGLPGKSNKSIPTEKEDDFWANYFHHFPERNSEDYIFEMFLIRWHRMEMADADLCKTFEGTLWYIWSCLIYLVSWFFVSKFRWSSIGSNAGYGIAAFRYVQCVLYADL